MRERRKCIKCGHHWAWQLSDGRFKCRRCKARYRWRSVWQASRLSEANKRRLLEFFVLGVPVYRARFRSPVSRPAAERFFRQIRQVLALHEELSAPFAGAIECDETMFGGHRRGKRGWGAAGKVLVFGMLKRNGMVRVFAVSGRSCEQLLPLIAQHTTPGSLFYTDDWHAYTALCVRGNHVIISKERGVPKGRDHINGIEGFWSYAKNWLYPYRGVPRKFFHLFLGELCFRFNHRQSDLFPLIYKLLHQTDATVVNQLLVQIR
jgi:transposase